MSAQSSLLSRQRSRCYERHQNIAFYVMVFASGLDGASSLIMNASLQSYSSLKDIAPHAVSAPHARDRIPCDEYIAKHISKLEKQLIAILPIPKTA